MMILTTLATAAAILSLPAQPAEPDPSTQIHLTCSLIVVRDMDMAVEHDIAHDDVKKAVFTIADLRASGPKMVRGKATLDIGDGNVVFTLEDGRNLVDVSASHGRASLIAQPRILALYGQEAAINVGTEVTFIQTIEPADGDEGFHRVKFAKRFEGFELSVVGFDANGAVRLDPLRLRISGISGHRTMEVGDAMSIDSPIFTEKELMSSLILPPDDLAIIPIGPMPDKSGFLIAAISAGPIIPAEPSDKSNTPGSP